MKKYISFLFILTCFVLTACGQNPPASPAAKATGKAGNANITISYSRPSVKGRKIFGDLVPYGKVWRTGANEATVFETDGDLKVEGKSLPKGKYGLFTIPGEQHWTIIFSKNPNQWGSYKYKEDEDFLRVDVKPQAQSSLTEMLTFEVKNNKVGLKWENTLVEFQVAQ